MKRRSFFQGAAAAAAAYLVPRSTTKATTLGETPLPDFFKEIGWEPDRIRNPRIDYWTPFQMEQYRVEPDADAQKMQDTNDICFRIHPHTAEMVGIPMCELTTGIDFHSGYIFSNQAVVDKAFFLGTDTIHRRIWMDQWKVMLTAAYDRNMIVFDNTNEQGRFSYRLLCLLKDVARNNNEARTCSASPVITDLCLGTEAYYQYFGEDANPCTVVDRVEIRPNDELDPGGSLYDFLEKDIAKNEAGTWLPYPCVNIALAIDRREQRNFMTYVPGDHTLRLRVSQNRGRHLMDFDMRAGTVCMSKDRVLLGAF